MHFMDLITRYSSALKVTSTNLKEAVIALEASWVSQFWYPDSIRTDKAFQIGAFKDYADKLGIAIHPVPPGRHSKNAIESKHNVIRTIFLRLKEDAGKDFDSTLAAYKAVSISNDLYGNDTMSAFEMAKGFCNPVAAKPIDTVVPDDVRDARDQLQARRKLALILRSKAVTEIPLSVGDVVEVYQKKEHETRGKWSDPRPIISINHDARSLIVPGRRGREVTVAFEDARPALQQQSFAHMVQEGLDALGELHIEAHGITTEQNMPSSPEHSTANDADFSSDTAQIEPCVGDKISVFWPLDQEYYPGIVESEENDGRINVKYDDGDTECLDITKEVWKFNDSLTSSSSSFSNMLQVTSTENSVLSSMLEHFGNKPFMRHQAQGFEQFALVNAYKAEEETFLKTVRPVTHDKIPAGSNVISSHVLYKVKQNDEGSLKLKARIAPHGNEDDLKDVLSKDCMPCPPTGIRILESLASLFGWPVYRADVKAAFLQTGDSPVYITLCF